MKTPLPAALTIVFLPLTSAGLLARQNVVNGQPIAVSSTSLVIASTETIPHSRVFPTTSLPGIPTVLSSGSPSQTFELTTTTAVPTSTLTSTLPIQSTPPPNSLSTSQTTSPTSSPSHGGGVVPPSSSPGNTTTAGPITSNPQGWPLSSSDFQILSLALYQEHALWNILEYSLNYFGPGDFSSAGLQKQEMDMIGHMAEQAKAHTKILTEILGKDAPQECVYHFPFEGVREFLVMAMKFLKWGESGIFGYASTLQNQAAANILLQIVGIESRQQMAFRQFLGLPPMPVWFETRITPNMEWTLLAPYLKSCPYNPNPVDFQIYPALKIAGNDDVPKSSPAIDNSPGPMSNPGEKVKFMYDEPGGRVGPGEQKYTTKTSAKGEPKYAAWITQLEVVYTDLEGGSAKGNGTVTAGGDGNGDGDGSSGTVVYTKQPAGEIFPDSVGGDAVNGTVFVVLVDEKVETGDGDVTKLDQHIVAGPAVYVAG